MPDKKLTDNEIIKALERLKNTKDYLRELYQEQVKKCPYPELRPIAKQTYEDNKKAFDIAIKAIEEINRQKEENERLKNALTDHEYGNCVAVKNGLIYTHTLEDYDELIGDISAEARKEFAERLKSVLIIYTYQNFDGVIDNLVKEMESANND